MMQIDDREGWNRENAEMKFPLSEALNNLNTYGLFLRRYTGKCVQTNPKQGVRP
ncbi:MAG: hypothetical protein ACP5T9_06460 [Thermoplasmata archaeon]